MFVRLSLLDPQQADAGIKVIFEYQSKNHLMEIFDQFNKYFIAYWMKSVGPNGFCVGNLKHRTNNSVESFNAKLKRKLQKNPSAYSFLRQYYSFVH